MKLVRSITNDPKHLEDCEHEQFLFGGPLIAYKHDCKCWDKLKDVYHSRDIYGKYSECGFTDKLQGVSYDEAGNPFIVHIDHLGFSDIPMIDWCPPEVFIKKTPEGHFIGGYGEKLLKQYGHLSAKEYVSKHIIDTNPNLYVQET